MSFGNLSGSIESPVSMKNSKTGNQRNAHNNGVWPMRAFLVRTVLAAGCLALTSTVVAQPVFQVPYQSILGDNLTMNVWQGTNISFLTPVTSSDPVVAGLTLSTSAENIMGQIVTNVDQAYNYYALACGSLPAPYPPNYYVNGRSTIAAVDNTGGAGYSWIGSTGIELQTGTFDVLYNNVAANNQYDQVTFYELGRNFWTFGNQLNGNSSGVNIGQTSFTTGFAVFMRFQSMDYAGVQVRALWIVDLSPIQAKRHQSCRRIYGEPQLELREHARHRTRRARQQPRFDRPVRLVPFRLGRHVWRQLFVDQLVRFELLEAGLRRDRRRRPTSRRSTISSWPLATRRSRT